MATYRLIGPGPVEVRVVLGGEQHTQLVNKGQLFECERKDFSKTRAFERVEARPMIQPSPEPASQPTPQPTEAQPADKPEDRPRALLPEEFADLGYNDALAYLSRIGLTLPESRTHASLIAFYAAEFSKVFGDQLPTE